MIVKVIEIIAASEVSWDDALRNAIAEATLSLRHINSVDVIRNSAIVNDAGEITEYRTTVHIAFAIEHHSEPIGVRCKSIKVNV